MVPRESIVEPDSNRQRDNVLDRFNDAVLAFDRDWHFTYVNRQAAELLGRSAEDLVGRDARTEYAEAGQQFRRILEVAMAAQAPIRTETYWEPSNRWFENRIYPSPDGVSIVACDITEHKQAEQALRETADLLKDQNRVLSLRRGAEPSRRIQLRH